MPSVLFVGLVAIFVSSFFPFESAVAVSCFGTLFYYFVTNLSALSYNRQRFYPAGLAIAGLIGCIVLSISLPPQDIEIRVTIALVGIAFRLIHTKLIRYKLQ
jgi:APA family basic amino acid/polyamine antiporter